MFTMITQGTRKTVSAAAAVAVVSFGGLVMDQAYVAAAPAGTVEVGELTPLQIGATAIAQLPEITVVGRRDGAATYAMAELPEVVVVAKRVASMVAKEDGARRFEVPAINAGI